MAGEITVPWSNIKQLRSNQTFALLKPNAKLNRKDALAEVPEGTVFVRTTDKKAEISIQSPTSTTSLPVAQVSELIPTAQFTKALTPLRLTQGWGGTASGGVSLVRSTANSTNFNASIALTRALPQVAWLPAASRTSVNYTQSYGTTTQTGVAAVETNIYHAGAEQDQYFSPRFFVIADVAFDHNSSSNLDLQQSYGGGVGINLIKTPRQQLDFKGDLHYEKQSFFAPFMIDNIVGSTFSEAFQRNLPRKIVLSEFGSFTPAYNDPSAFSAHINAALGFPVYKGLGFSLSAVDDFINNAPAGTNQNSSQFLMNVTYTIKPK